jgi:hypothetical protein
VANAKRRISPQMFTLPKAAAGKYQVRVKYFAQDANRASTRTKVYATIYEGFGTPQETVTRKTVTLVAGKEMHEVATVMVARRVDPR